MKININCITGVKKYAAMILPGWAIQGGQAGRDFSTVHSHTVQTYRVPHKA